jgi:hypothetical protein
MKTKNTAALMTVSPTSKSNPAWTAAVSLLVGAGLMSAVYATGIPNAIVTYIDPDCSVTVYPYNGSTNVIYDVSVGTLLSNYDQCRVNIRGTNAVKTNTIVGATLHHALDGTNSGYGTNWPLTIPAQTRTSGAKTVTVTATNITVY